MSEKYPHPGVYRERLGRRPEYLGQPDPRVLRGDGFILVGMVAKRGKSRWMTDAELQDHRCRMGNLRP